MKKQFLFAALAIATLFTACSKEEELSKNTGTTPVNFVIGGVGSRTVTTLTEGEYSTDFKVDDKIGIYATGGATIKNQLLTVTAGDDETLTLTGDAIEYEQGVETTFKAYYPYVEGNGETVTMTVGDQADGIDQYDFVIATPEAISTGGEVTLTFNHQLAMVQVQVAGEIGETADNVTLKNVKPSVTWNVGETSVGQADGTATDITMYRIDLTNNIYVALVPVQTITSSTAMFSTTIGNKIYTFTPNSDVVLTASQVSKFKITIAEKVEMTTVGIENFNIAGWTYSTSVFENFGDPTEEPVPAIELISTQDFTNATLGTTAYGGHTNLPDAGWAQIGAALSEVSLNNGTLTIKNTASPSSWYQAGVAYRSENLTKQAHYKLSLNLACDTSENTEGLVLRVYKYDTEQSKFISLNIDKYPTARAEKWEYDIDLSEVPVGYPIIIGIGVKTVSELNTTYSITNMTMVEIQE